MLQITRAICPPRFAGCCGHQCDDDHVHSRVCRDRLRQLWRRCQGLCSGAAAAWLCGHACGAVGRDTFSAGAQTAQHHHICYESADVAGVGCGCVSDGLVDYGSFPAASDVEVGHHLPASLIDVDLFVSLVCVLAKWCSFMVHTYLRNQSDLHNQVGTSNHCQRLHKILILLVVVVG